jgi:hypothetical protein
MACYRVIKGVPGVQGVQGGVRSHNPRRRQLFEDIALPRGWSSGTSWLLTPLLVLLVLLFPSSTLGIPKQLDVKPVAVSVTMMLADIDQR